MNKLHLAAFHLGGRQCAFDKGAWPVSTRSVCQGAESCGEPAGLGILITLDSWAIWGELFVSILHVAFL